MFHASLVPSFQRTSNNIIHYTTEKRNVNRKNKNVSREINNVSRNVSRQTNLVANIGVLAPGILAPGSRVQI